MCLIFRNIQFYDRAEIKGAPVYLRIIAYKDDLSILQICNTPKRNLGKQRIAFLKEYVGKKGITRYEALKEILDSPELKSTKAGQFARQIDSDSASCEGR